MAGHPICTKQDEVIISPDKPIDIICTNYGNRVMILLSDRQLQKIATMLLVRRECKGPEAAATFSVTTLLGTDSPEVHVFGRAIGGLVLVPETPDVSLIVGLGMRHPEPTMIPSVLKKLDDLNVWSHDSNSANVI